jgi:hypothetical protein
LIDVLRYGWRIFRNERLDAFNCKPVSSPADAFWQCNFLLSKHAVKVDLFVIHEVDRAYISRVRKWQSASEYRGIVWIVTIKRFDVQNSKGLVDV